MSTRILLIVLSVILSVTACSAPTPSAETPKAAPETVAAAPAAPTTDTLLVTNPPPASAEKAPTGPVSGLDPANPNRACKTDADCTVKDVGNCCGAYPMCVNKDAHTDPAAVRAQCVKNDMASICGFREVRGCTCVQGQCQDIADGEVVM